MPGMPWDQPQPDPLTPDQRAFLGYGGQGQPADWYSATGTPGGMNTGAQGPGWAGQSAARTQPQHLPPNADISGLTPQQQMLFRLMLSRGTGGMQNPLAGVTGTQGTQNLAGMLQGGGQQGGLMAAIMQNPQLLQWFMQQQGAPGQFPQGGGGVTLAQLLGAPSQMTGQPA